MSTPVLAQSQVVRENVQVPQMENHRLLVVLLTSNSCIIMDYLQSDNYETGSICFSNPLNGNVSKSFELESTIKKDSLDGISVMVC